MKMLWTICALILPALVINAHGVSNSPTTEGETGRKAWDLLGGLYQAVSGDGGIHRVMDDVIVKMSGEDADDARDAADLLVAIFRQVAADESNGRAEWRRSGAWGGGADSKARDFRKSLAERLGKAQPSKAAVRVTEWLLANEQLSESLKAATKLLERCRNDQGDHAILNVLEHGSHWRPAVVMALVESGRRSLKERPELIRKWAADPRMSVRRAAAESLKTLGFEPPPAFEAEKGFTAPIEKMLADILALLPQPLEPGAKLGTFKVLYEAGNGSDKVHEIIGWQHGETNGVLKGMSWHGRVLGTWYGKVSFTPENPERLVGRIRAVRDAKDEEARRRRLDLLSVQGSLTGQFEPWQISVPEGLLAAWLYRQGNRALAAKLLFPLLDDIDDDRWAFGIVRDLVGGRCHESMLNAFCYQRDYVETLRLAKHLSQPLFDGYDYQSRAKELVEQLPKRADDFKTHRLPSAEEWKNTADGMSREQQLEFLASRLRLLNCFQLSQPGGVSYSDEQHPAPESYSDGRAPEWVKGEKQRVINPWNELRKMKLGPADVPVLAPYLKDENYLPTYSYWRGFHPSRTLHRVNWLVAALVNDAVWRTLINIDEWQELDAPGRDAKISQVVAWAQSMAGRPTVEVLRLNMAEAPSVQEWFYAAREAARRREPSLMPDLLVGAEKHAKERARIAELCVYNGAATALPAARRWLKADDSIRRFGALIVIKHGDQDERRGALKALKGIMDGKWDESLMINTIEPMLSLQDDAVTEIACGVLRRRELDWRWIGATVAAHLLRTKHPAALAAIVDGISSTAAAKVETGTWKDQEVKRTRTRGDRVAEAVAVMRRNYLFPSFAPDKERAEARNAMVAWLKEQAALLKAGLPTPELIIYADHISAPEWQLDAP